VLFIEYSHYLSFIGLNITTTVLALGLAIETILVSTTTAIDEGLATTLERIVGIAFDLAKTPSSDHRLQAHFNCNKATQIYTTCLYLIFTKLTTFGGTTSFPDQQKNEEQPLPRHFFCY